MYRNTLELNSVVQSLKATVKQKVAERNALALQLQQYDRELHKIHSKIDRLIQRVDKHEVDRPKKDQKSTKTFPVDTCQGILHLTKLRYRILKILVDNGEMQYNEIIHELRRRYKEKASYDTTRTVLYALEALKLVKHVDRATWDAVG